MDIIYQLHSSVVSLGFLWGIQSVCQIYGSFAHLIYSSVVSQSLIKAESNAVNRFRVPKICEEESKLLKESFPKSTVKVVFLICISCYA